MVFELNPSSRSDNRPPNRAATPDAISAAVAVYGTSGGLNHLEQW